MTLTPDQATEVMRLAADDRIAWSDVADLLAAHPYATTTDLAEAVAGWPMGTFALDTTHAIHAVTEMENN